MTDDQRAADPAPGDGASAPGSGSDQWDPWGSWSADRTGTSDQTAPVDLDRTQEVPVAATATDAGAPSWASAADQGATQVATGPDPVEPTRPVPATPVTVGSPSYGAPAAPPGSFGLPAPGQGSPVAPSASPTRTRPPRRGPGWSALVVAAALAAVLGGVGGGYVGGYLATHDAVSATGNDSSTVPTPGPAATERPAGSVASIAAKALPSVVTIRVVSSSGGGSTGSGWVYDTKGHVVTNNHVIADAGDGGKVTVVLSNGKQVSGTVVGRDESYDLAVVKLDRTDLTPLPVGVSADVVVGDPVIAVGAPLGLDSTVTTGIVSALNRPVAPGGSGGGQSYINAIQTDAAINPGNSGGPLLDMSGRVIGVNSAIAQIPGADGSAQSGSIGVGFAIPSDQVRKTVDQLIATGKAQHPIIGVLMDLNYTGEGVRIAESGSGGAPAVTPGGPAAKAGLKPGDVILELDGRPITSPDELVVAIRAHSVGDTVTLTVRRNGTDRSVELTLQASQ